MATRTKKKSTASKGPPEFWDRLKWLTNGTFDDVLKQSGLLPSLGLDHGKKGYPLSDAELNFMEEGGLSLAGVPHADLMGGHSVLLDKQKYHANLVEFHFRNDATRHMWGTPVTLETDLPDRASVLDRAWACSVLAEIKIKNTGGKVYLQTEDFIDTDDRFALWMFVPFQWIMKTFENRDQYQGFLKTLFV